MWVWLPAYPLCVAQGGSSDPSSLHHQALLVWRLSPPLPKVEGSPGRAKAADTLSCCLQAPESCGPNDLIPAAGCLHFLLGDGVRVGVCPWLLSDMAAVGRRALAHGPRIIAGPLACGLCPDWKYPSGCHLCHLHLIESCSLVPHSIPVPPPPVP